MKTTYTKPEISVRKVSLSTMITGSPNLKSDDLGIQEADPSVAPTSATISTSGDGVSGEHYDVWGDARGNRGGFGHSWD